MKKRKINIFGLLTLTTLMLGGVVSAQNSENLTVNNGNLFVKPNTVISTYFDFYNKDTGNVINDGEFYFYGNYQNEGLFSFTDNQTSGYVIFEGASTSVQNINGASPSMFYDILFNKTGELYSFELNNDISSQGIVNFNDGIIQVNKESGGAFHFLKGSTHINAADKSHINGQVTKIGNESFRFPKGDGGFYRFSEISEPAHESHSYIGQYHLGNSNIQYPHNNRVTNIDMINDQEYWTINQAVEAEETVILTLSWDERTTPSTMYANGGANLHIVRWDPNQNIWVDEGGIVNYSSKTVTTPAHVKGFDIFTLAKMKDQTINDGEIVIYNGVTPDDDGINDYFIIENIHNFPNNTVTIFNRWGSEVYKTTNYDSNGNVFKGKAEGVKTFGKDEKLTSGTYYYVIEYLDNRNEQNNWIKKAGYLHLENN